MIIRVIRLNILNNTRKIFEIKDMHVKFAIAKFKIKVKIFTIHLSLNLSKFHV